MNSPLMHLLLGASKYCVISTLLQSFGHRCQGVHQAAYQTGTCHAKVIVCWNWQLALFEYWIDVVKDVSFRYPPPDECAKRRCVLGRCLEEKQVCDRVWDCQVSDINDRNLG